MVFYFFHNNFDRKGPSRLLRVFIIIDILFAIGHVLIALFWSFEPRSFMLDTDRGYPEFFQYFKCLLIVIFIAELIFLEKKYGYFTWLILFSILLLDDALQFHEKSGRYFARALELQPAFGLRDVDLGELTYAALVGLVASTSLVVSYYRGSRTFRNTCIDIALLFSVLIFFGIGMDMAHQWVVDIYGVSAVVALIEDGGEMIAMTFIVWYFYFIVAKKNQPRIFLFYSLISENRLRQLSKLSNKEKKA